MTVEKVFDELRIGAKDLSSWVIAGSLRNAFRGSVGQHAARVPVPLFVLRAAFLKQRADAADLITCHDRLVQAEPVAYPAVRQRGLSSVVERETAQDRRIRPQICVQSLRQ